LFARFSFHSRIAVTEVQIAVHSTGICGSDVSYYTKGFIGDFVVREPMVLGHESSGIVSKLGEGVTNLKVGMLNIALRDYNIEATKLWGK